MSISRRKFLGWLGAAGLGTAVGHKTARAASNKTFSGYPQSNGVLFDNTRCIGCRKCEEGCNKVNELPEPDNRLVEGDRLIIVGHIRDLERLLTGIDPAAFPGPV